MKDLKKANIKNIKDKKDEKINKSNTNNAKNTELESLNIKSSVIDDIFKSAKK